MVSRLAERDAARLSQMGVTLSLADSVRLNALGLQVEHSPNLHQPYLLPRVAIVDKLVLREPTLGQQIWLDDFTRLVNFEDNVTCLCVSALAYSTPSSDLPPLSDLDMCIERVRELSKRIQHIGVRALASALLYVAKGIDDTLEEYAPKPKGETDVNIPEDADISISLGVMLDGVVVKLGVSLSEAKSLTRSQLEYLRNEAIEASLIEQGVKAQAISETRRRNKHREYLRFYDELRRRKTNG
jgi:hypothetical protein